MARIEKSIEINAPVGKVFTYLKDFEKMPEWNPSCKSHKITSKGKIGVGSTSHIVMESMGQKMEYDSELTEYVENKKLSWHSDKPSRMDGTFAFTPIDKGTKLTFIMDYDLPYSIFGAILDKLKMSKEIEKALDEATKNLKKILEK